MLWVRVISAMHFLLAALWGTMTLHQTKGEEYKEEDWESLWQKYPNYSKVNCTFTNGNPCGWQNLGDNDVNWTKAGIPGTGDYVQALFLKDLVVDSKGRLASPWLPAIPCHTCFMHFSSFVGRGSKLTLIRETESGDHSPHIEAGQGKSTIPVNCSDTSYRIIFQGKRLSCDCYIWLGLIRSGCCEDYQKAIFLENVQYTVNLNTSLCRTWTSSTSSLLASSQVYATSISTTHQTSPTKSSIMQDKTDNLTLANHMAESSKRDIDDALLAGIIVAVMAVLIGGAIFLIILLRRRRKNGKESNHGFTHCFKKRANSSRAKDVPQVGTNSTYEIDEGQISGNARDNVKPEGKYTGSVNVYTEADDSYTKFSFETPPEESYELAKLPTKSSSTIKPINNDPDCCSQPTKKHSNVSLHASSINNHNSFQEDYAVPTGKRTADNVVGRGRPSDRKTAGQGHVQDDNVYSLARNDGVSSAEEAAAIFAEAATTDYETVDNNDGLQTSSSAPRADVYNRLGIKALPTAGDKQETYQNHYNYLNDSVGIETVYNQLHREDKLRNQQRELIAVEYSHI